MCIRSSRLLLFAIFDDETRSVGGFVGMTDAWSTRSKVTVFWRPYWSAVTALG